MQELNSPISLAQAAKLSGYSAEHIRRLCVAGKISGQKIGKSWVVSEADVLRFKNGQTTVAPDLAEITGTTVGSYSKLQKVALATTMVLIVIAPIMANLSHFFNIYHALVSKGQSETNRVVRNYLQTQGFGLPKPNTDQSPQAVVERAINKPEGAVLGADSTAVSDDQILNSLRNILQNGLPNDLKLVLQGPPGPAGPAGPAGPMGLAGADGVTTTETISSAYIPNSGSVFGITAPTAQQGSAGTIGSATYLSSKEFITEKLTVTGNITTSGGATLDSLNVANDSLIGGDLTVMGTTTLNGLVITNNSFTSNSQATFTKVPTLAHSFTPSWPAGTSNGEDGTVYINPGSSVGDGNLLVAAVGGVAQFVVDAEGDVYANNLILSGSTSTGATTIAGNLTVQDSTVLGDASADTITFNAQAITDLTFKKADPTLIFDVPTAGDTDFWAGVMDDAGGDDDDLFQIGDGTTPGTNPFLTIKTSGNVGIGTTNPGDPLVVGNQTGIGGVWALHFRGDNNACAALPCLRTGGNGSIVLSPNTAAGTAGFVYLNYDGGAVGGGVIVGNGNGSELVRFTSGGNVGIGTTNPTSILHVEPSGGLVGDLIARVKNTDAGTTSRTFIQAVNDQGKNASLIAHSSTYLDTFAGIPMANSVQFSGGTSPSAVFFGVTGGQPIYISQKGLSVPAISIPSTGNVGIGTTNPAYKLEVNASDASINSVRVGQGPNPNGTPADGNLVLGNGAGNSLAVGSYRNYLMGYGAGANITTGGDNVIISNATGAAALNNAVIIGTGANAASGSVVIGNLAGQSSSGQQQVLIGLNAGRTGAGGLGSIAIGRDALTANAGAQNIAIGYMAGSSITSGANNVIIGGATGSDIATSSNNIIIADGAGNQRIKVLSSGNVGIGTTNPGAKLAIETTTASAEALRFTNTSDGVSFLSFQRSGDSTRGLRIGEQYVPSDNAAYIRTAGGLSQSLTLQSGLDGSSNRGTLYLNPFGGSTWMGGSIMIGGGPEVYAGILNVSSNTAGSGQTYFTQANASTDGFDLYFRKARGTAASPSAITSGDELGVINFDGYSGAAGYVTGVAIKALSSGTVATTRIPGVLSFWTGTDAAPTVLTERMRIDSIGNVGIGTTNPATLLYVSGARNDLFTLENTNVNGRAWSLYVQDTGASANGNLLIFDKTSSIRRGTFRTDGGVSLGGNIGNDRGDGAIISLDPNSTVGINSNQKLSTLTVLQPADTANIGGTTTANASTTITGVGTTFTTSLGIGDRISLSSSAATYATITAIASDTSLTVDAALGNGTSQTINRKKSIFRLDNNAAATKLVVNDLGSVGIGTTNPSVLLHLASANPQIYLDGASSGTQDNAVRVIHTPTGTNDGGTSWRVYGTSVLTTNERASIVMRRIGVVAGNNAVGDYPIIFNTAAADAQDSEKMRILGNGNVGIGTTNPGYQLEVNATGISTPVNLVRIIRSNASDNLTDAALTIEHSGSGDPSLKFILTGGEKFIMGIDNSDGDKFKIGKANNLGVQDYLTIDTSGQLGIGTTSPAAALDVKSGTSNGYAFQVRDTTNAQIAGIYNVTGSGGILEVDDGSAVAKVYLNAQSAGTSFVSAAGNAKLGIGTTQPDSKLHVGGTLDSGGHIRGIYFNGTLNTTSPGFYTAGIASVPTFGTGSTNLSDAIGIYTGTPTKNTSGTITNSYGVIVDTNSMVATNSYGIKIVSPTGGTSLNYALQTTGAAMSAFAGNVGIGTTNPTGGKLHVVGDSFFNGNSAFGGTAVSSNALVTVGANLNDPAGTTYGLSSSRTLVLSANNAQSVVGGAFAIATAANAFNQSGELVGGNFQASTALTATTTNLIGSRHITYNTGTGTVTNGIGSYHTIQNLNASGIITNAYGVKADVGFNLGTLTNTYGFYAGDITTGTQTNTPYSFYASDANAYNYFAGSVGIGTTAPGSKLEIEGTAAGDSSVLTIDSTSATGSIAFREAGVVRGFLGFGDDGNIVAGALANSVALRSENALHLATNGGNIRMTIDTSGNVGIGTTGPTHKLDVNGALKIYGQNVTHATSALVLGQDSSTRSQIRAYGPDATTAGILDFEMSANDGAPTVAAMTILGSGNVGIGTTNPGNKFSIEAAGAVYAGITSSDGAGDAQWAFRSGVTYKGGIGWDQSSDTVGIFNATTSVTPIITIESDAAGNVGIGTTNPSARLHTWGAEGAVTIEGNSNCTTAGNNVLMLRSDVASADDPVFRVQCNGATFADGAYTGTGADFAEYFETLDTTLAAGELVSLDVNHSEYIKRSSTNDSQPIVGVISTKPSFVANGMPNLQEASLNYKPVALAGRVPVKVSEENGQIHTGDRLTASIQLPGYAAKMIESGQSIGIALEDSHGGSDGTDEIVVFVNLGYQKVEVTQNAQGQLVAIDHDLDLGGHSMINVKSIASANGKWSIDENGLLIVEKIQTKELCIEDICVNKDQLRTLLQNNGLMPDQGTVSGDSAPPAEEPPPVDESVSSEEPTTPPAEEPAPPAEPPPAETPAP